MIRRARSLLLVWTGLLAVGALVPDRPAAQTVPAQLRLSVNQAAFAPGDAFRLDLSSQAGSPAAGNVRDLYVAVLLPDGTLLVLHGAR